MIRGFMSVVLGAFIILCGISVVFILFATIDTFERKISHTKIYKITKLIMTILFGIFLVGMLLFSCWRLGEILISAIIGG